MRSYPRREVVKFRNGALEGWVGGLSVLDPPPVSAPLLTVAAALIGGLAAWTWVRVRHGEAPLARQERRRQQAARGSRPTATSAPAK